MYHFSSSPTDIVFFIFLYQRWIYRVDPKRVNEFGTSGEDGSATTTTPDGPGSQAAATGAIKNSHTESRKTGGGPDGLSSEEFASLLPDKKND